MKAALAGALLGVIYPDISDVLVQVEALLLPGEIEQRPLRLHLQDRLAQRAALGGGCVKTAIYAMLLSSLEALHGGFHRRCQPSSDNAFS